MIAQPRDLVRRRYRRKSDPIVPLTDTQRELAEKYLPLARKLAKPFKTRFGRWSDEFESAACAALVEAARSYDPTRNIRFSTFARFRIRGELVDFGKIMGFAIRNPDDDNPPDIVSLNRGGEEYSKVLAIHEPPEVGAEFDDIDAVEGWLRKLPAGHARVCRLYYLYGKTFGEIGGEIGCSSSGVVRLHRKAIELLSDPYDTNGGTNQLAWRRQRAKRS